MLVTIVDLRPPLFVGMRVSFVPDTLTFSRKHSCLHFCSLGRDTYYSLCSSPLTRRLCPPGLFLPSPLACLPSFQCWMPYELLRMLTHTYTRVPRRACISREKRLNAPLSVQTRMRIRLKSRRWTPSPSPLLFPLSPFLASAPFPALPLAHSTRVRTLRDVRVCQWNTLSLSGGRQKGGRERGGEAGGGTVPGNSGSRSDAGGGKRLGRWLLVAHWRCTEAFDLSLSLSLSLFVHLVSRHLSPSHLSIPPFPLTHPGLFFCTTVPPHPDPSALRV